MAMSCAERNFACSSSESLENWVRLRSLACGVWPKPLADTNETSKMAAKSCRFIA
jgi:hypothetical protein